MIRVTYTTEWGTYEVVFNDLNEYYDYYFGEPFSYIIDKIERI